MVCFASQVLFFRRYIPLDRTGSRIDIALQVTFHHTRSDDLSVFTITLDLRVFGFIHFTVELERTH
ncbi:hypothetical protein L195_g053904 [Trifolium pratense]|uniref:Uncharacterized protein n=1 Tax=Trifolium pratense TaxID=57577 RepID=A0A2K3KD29_TRIPR|nr:hypothetical protein L195_g053904 [Trifolium pratense]